MSIRSAVRSTCFALLVSLALLPQAVAQPEPAPGPLEPTIPDIQDPMLETLPDAPHTLNSWQQALKLVRTRSTTLNTQLAQVIEANGQARQALSRSLPTLTANASLTRHLLLGEGPVPPFDSFPLRTGTIPDPATTWQAGLNLRVPLFVPRSWHDASTARQAVEVARLSTSEIERQLLGAVAEAIVNAVTAERLLEVSTVSLRSALSTLDLNRRRARLGAANAVDVLRAEQEVAFTRSQVISAAEGVLRAREALGLALGTAEPWSVTPRISLDSLASDAAKTCRLQQDVEQRSDVRAARANLDVAHRNVDAVNWSYWPTLEGVSGLTYSPNDEFTANREHVTWTIGAVLTWTIYDGGFRYGEKMANTGRALVAREQLTETKRQALIEVEQARRGVAVSQANLEVARRARDVAKESARLARIAFVQGGGTSFDLVDTVRRLRETELDLAIQEFRLIRAKIAAMLAMATCNI